jgi:hypothetical protein
VSVRWPSRVRVRQWARGHRRSGPRLTLGERAAAHLLGWPIYGELTTRLVAVTSLVGFPGCLALGLRDALCSMTTMLVLTDQRVMVAETPFELKAPPTLTWVATRTAVAEMTVAPRLAQRGRVMVTLADGSGLAVMLGTLRAAAAKRFVGAWRDSPAW